MTKQGKRQKFKKESSPVYEVEQIVDHKVEKKKHFYLVKWKDWPASSNTWEPFENLDNCHDEFFLYLERLTNGISPTVNKKKYISLRETLSKCEFSDLSKMLVQYNSAKGVSIPPPDEETTAKRLLILAKWPEDRRDPKVVELVRKNLIEEKLYEARQAQIDALKDWENEIYSIVKKLVNGAPPIKVINDVDLEGPPENFIYVNDYLPGEGVIIPEDPPFGCSCEPTCSSLKKRCCPTTTGGVYAYKNGLLKVPKGTPIYECNKMCKCGPECGNRVVQKGRTKKLCIFRTGSCGWGVKTLELISKGAFVTEYVGEVITFEEAERRGKIYDREGQTYLFDLDFNDENAYPYTVDAAVYGNVSHFVNHSCDPNMTVYAIWGNCLDPNLPKLALFANREIKAGEEISFDYLNQSKTKTSDETEKKNGAVIKKTNYYNMLCKCGSKKCRKFYL